MHTRRIIGFTLAFGLAISMTSLAQGAEELQFEEGAIGRVPPRLSSTWGEVSFYRPGAEDWSQAQVNTPLAPGDLLYTGPQGNLEIQIGARAFARGGPNTQLGLENQEPDFLQFKVTAGNASFDLHTVEPGRTVEVDTPNAVFTIEQAGYYRVDVTGESTSFIARRGGQATASYPGGEPLAIEPSEDVIIEGTETPRVTSYAAPQLDKWDMWNYARTNRLLDAVSARYVSPGVYGVDDLDVYGTWRMVPEYGAVWVPREVSSGWVPYSTGAWVDDPYYGWTWVDTAPWGWAPYHYGRWVFVSGFWAWAPGPVVARPSYAPALVAFLGGPTVSVGVSVGIAPVVGWVALGWGEPCVPWWGPAPFRHRPWWGGWGGPRVVDNVVIRSTTVVNVQEINVYRNVSVRNAVVVVKEDHFGRGPIKSGRVTRIDVKNFRPIHNGPSVAPTAGSFVPREERGVRPPEKILGRSVVATRPPQVRAASAAGRVQGAARERLHPAPAPRIVSAPQHRETAPALRRPPYGQKGAERPTERARSAGPPSVERPRGPERVPQGPSQKAQPPQREAQPGLSSRAQPRPSEGRAEPGQVQPTAPPKMEGAPGPERTTKAPASVSPRAQPQRTPESIRPSREESQSSGSRTAPARAQPAVPPGIESPQGHGQAPRGRPSAVPRQVEPAPSPQQGGSHKVGAPSAESRLPAPGSESARPRSRVLPGEPANRVSPSRSERKPQQRLEKPQEPEQSAPQRGRPEPRGRQGD